MKSSKIPSSRINMTSIPSVIAAVVVIALLLTLCAAPALAGGSRVADVNASQPVDNSTWYLAEGSIAWGFDTYITIENPNDVEVNADVTYMPTAAANVHKEYTLPLKATPASGATTSRRTLARPKTFRPWCTAVRVAQ